MPGEKSQTKLVPGSISGEEPSPHRDFAANPLFFLLGGPALLHEAEQMLDGFFVAAIFLYGKLLGPFIELGGHFNGFIGWATQRYQGFGKMGIFHGKT